LVHDDIHHGNIFLNNGSITVFDFDDCRYHWYVNDLAISLFYLIQDKASGQNKNEFARQTLGYFMEGYYRENDLPRSQLAQIGNFLKFREIILYLIIHEEKAFEVNNWDRRYMDGRRLRIENDVPFVDIDFGEL
jgi:Ser/Thr protein kinase RdoA (MazF antagonist)